MCFPVNAISNNSHISLTNIYPTYNPILDLDLTNIDNNNNYNNRNNRKRKNKKIHIKKL